jgi:cell division protein FtsB
MVLQYDAYNETIDDKKQNEDALATLSDQVMKLTKEIEVLKKSTH